MNTRKQQTARGLSGALGLIILGALCAPAFAGGTVGSDVTVRYADLDVGSEAGARKLLQRIEWAARRVCAPLDHGSLTSRVHEDSCRRQVTEAAVIKVNHPVLQATYELVRSARPPVASLRR